MPITSTSFTTTPSSSLEIEIDEMGSGAYHSHRQQSPTLPRPVHMIRQPPACSLHDATTPTKHKASPTLSTSSTRQHSVQPSLPGSTPSTMDSSNHGQASTAPQSENIYNHRKPPQRDTSTKQEKIYGPPKSSQKISLNQMTTTTKQISFSPASWTREESTRTRQDASQ